MIPYVPKSPLQLRASFLLSRAALDSWASRSETIRGFLASFRALVDSVGKPALVIRPLYDGEVPYQDDYDAMNDELRHDVSALQSTTPLIGQQGVELFNYAVIETDAIKEQVALAVQHLTTTKAALAQITPGHYIGIGNTAGVARQPGQRIVEQFAVDVANHSSSSGIAYLPQHSWVTLQEVASINHSLSARATFLLVDADGNLLGLPGTTTEVLQETAQSVGVPDISFVGERGSHADITAILDDDPLTWFEFERCALLGVLRPSSVTTTTSQYIMSGAFSISGSTTKTTETTTTRNAALSIEQPVMQIEDSWHYSGTGMPRVLADLVSPDTWEVTIKDRDTYKTFPKLGTPSGGVLRLIVTMTLPAPKVLTAIDVDPYIPEQAKSSPVAIERIQITTANQVEHVIPTPMTWASGAIRVPVTLTDPIAKVEITYAQPSAYQTLLGHPYYVVSVQQNSANSGFFGFNASQNSTSTRFRIAKPEDAEQYTKTWTHHHLFSSTVTSTSASAVQQGVDTFLGKRWQIGLRTVALLHTQYTTAGQFVSTPYSFVRPIQGVVVTPDMTLPPHTNAVYAVSPDSGTTWIPVEPQQFVALPSTTTLVVKVSLTREATDERFAAITPILRGYTLQGVFA